MIAGQNHHSPEARLIRRLIWLYFWLLILEGPLRKWILTGLSDPLLVVRDPIVLAIYALSISGNFVRMNGFIASTILLGIASLATTIFFTDTDWGILAYGFRANFLHLPLIFIIPILFHRKDVLEIGKYCLYLLIPMAILMMMQFQAHPDHFWNYGPGATPGSQMEGALGRIRAPGYFSFITGAAQFLGLCTAFALFGFIRKKTYPFALLTLASAAIVISVSVSISRLALGSILVTIGMLVVIQILNPGKQVARILKGAFFLILVILAVMQTPIFKEGTDAFESRLERTGDAGEGLLGIAQNWGARTWQDTTGGLSILSAADFFGEGLGKGTNVGAHHQTGKLQFLLAEGEWARVILEMGPILGILFILWRILLVITLFQKARRALLKGNQLPLLLFGSGGLLLLAGQWGQSTTHGFAILIAGFTLAACRASVPSSRPPEVIESLPEEGEPT